MQTVVLKIKIRTPNRAKSEHLHLLRQVFTDCVRFHCERIAKLKTTNANEIHRDCYQEAKQRFRLPTSTLQQARDKAIAAYRKYLEGRKRDQRVNPPTFQRLLPLRLAAQNLKVLPDKGVIRVSTSDGFLWLPILIPEHFSDAVKMPHAVSEIVSKGKDWYLMLAVKHEDVPVRTCEQSHFGLDLGLANLAVLTGPGVVKFFDGKPLRYTRGRYHRYRQSLQIKRKTGMVKRSKGKEANWAMNENHRVSREIVDIVAKAGGVLHIECLKGIRGRCKGTAKTRRMLNTWSFGQFIEFIKYKARLAGVLVVEEDPRHTSQRCSRCGHTERGNRSKQADFACKSCGFRCHADLNAARNLAAKGACSLGVGGVTPPRRLDAGNGEATAALLSCRQGNRNLESSL